MSINRHLFTSQLIEANFIYSKHKVVTTDSLDSDIKVPAALNLPFGKLFFGFNVTAYTPPPAAVSSKSSEGTAPVGILTLIFFKYSHERYSSLLHSVARV